MLNRYNEVMNKGNQEDGVVYHAGFPNAAEDQRAGSLSLDALVIQHRASTFFWELESDITDLHWQAGSVVVVDRALSPRHGDTVVAIVDETFVVRVYHLKNKQPYLRAPDGSIENDIVTIWGIVTYIVQGMRS